MKLIHNMKPLAPKVFGAIILEKTTMANALPVIKASALAVTLGLLSACGGSSENIDLTTLGEQIPASEKDRYYIPNDFYNKVQYVSETLQYQTTDSYLEFSYTDEYTAQIDQTTILADGLPGDVLYARILVTGLATGVSAQVSIESEGDFAKFALDTGTGFYGDTSFEDDITKLNFQQETTSVTNGTWVWVKIPITEYEQIRSVKLKLGNLENPETGTVLDGGFKEATITAKSPQLSTRPLPFEFSNRQGLNALGSGESLVSPIIEVTKLETLETAISDLVTQHSHQITGLTSESAPIYLTDTDHVAQYRIKRRGAQEFEPWTSEAGTVHPFDRVEVKITASETKLATVSASLTIGEGTDAVSAEWTVDTLGDLDMSRGVLFPPQTSFTNAKAINIRGRVLLRDTADETTELASLTLKKRVTSTPDAVEENVNLIPQYNQLNGLWETSITLTEEASAMYTLEAVTSLGETVTSHFNLTHSNSIPIDFPTADNKLTRPVDVSVDLANNRYIVNDTPWNNAKLIAVDMTTSERTLLMDTNALWGGKSNSYGVQVDYQNNRVLTSDNPSDDLYQFNLSDPNINSILSSSQSPVVGKGPFMQEPSEIDLDYNNNRIVMGNDNAAGNGIYVYDMESGDRCKYTDGRIKSVAVDNDLNRYLFLMGTRGDSLMSAPIVATEISANSDCSVNSIEFGIDKYADGRSIAVASYKQLESPEALEQWRPDGFTSDGQPVAVEDQVGFALIGDKSDKQIYKVDLKDGTRQIFSGNGIPDFNVPFINPDSVVVEQGLGFALVADDETGALFGVDLKTGQRVIISK